MKPTHVIAVFGIGMVCTTAAAIAAVPAGIVLALMSVTLISTLASIGRALTK